MGIYTSNRFVVGEAYDYAAEIPANEAYDAAFGCAHIMADNQANDMALFESAIYSDMAEVMSLQEGTQIVNENAFTDVIKKIVEMFKKLLAKIKGIFNAFLAKLAGAFKNGKDLVKKYEKQIIKYSNWKDLKIKGIRKPRAGKEDIKSAIFGTGTTCAFKFAINDAYQIDSRKNTADAAYAPHIGGSGTNNTWTTSKIKDADTEELKLALLKAYTNVTVSDYKEFSEKVTEFLYEDEATFDGEDDKISSSTFTSKWVKGVLMDEKWESEVRKTNDNLDKIINKIIDDLNKTNDNLATFIQNNSESDKAAFKGSNNGKWEFRNNKDSVNKDSRAGGSVAADFEKETGNGQNASKLKASELQQCIQACQKVASNEQEVITKVTSEYMSQVKFAMAQARKMWTAAAAWSSTTHKESVEYYQALGEAAAEQFYMNMESIGTRKED